MQGYISSCVTNGSNTSQNMHLCTVLKSLWTKVSTFISKWKNSAQQQMTFQNSSSTAMTHPGSARITLKELQASPCINKGHDFTIQKNGIHVKSMASQGENHCYLPKKHQWLFEFCLHDPQTFWMSRKWNCLEDRGPVRSGAHQILNSHSHKKNIIVKHGGGSALLWWYFAALALATCNNWSKTWFLFSLRKS